MMIGCGKWDLVTFIFLTWMICYENNRFPVCIFWTFQVVYGKLVKWEKKNRESFSNVKSWRAKKLLGIAHSDLCSVKTPTYGGWMYFITFIDHFSRKTWVYFLRQESEVVDALKTVKAFVEKQSGCQIKARKQRPIVPRRYKFLWATWNSTSVNNQVYSTT